VSQPQPHEIVWALSTAGFAARCLHVVSELGVADRIGDEPMPVEELAASCGVDSRALDRVLRLLTTQGVFDRQDDGYRHTPSSLLLRDDHPMSMRAFGQMMGLPLIWGSLQELRHAVETGKPAMEKLEPKGAWAYLQDRPDEADIFARAMTAKAGADIAAVLAVYDFTRFKRIADIAGGRGHLLRAILAAAPAAEGVLFDLPIVIDSLTVDDEPRLSTQAGDFFVDALPAADAYLLLDVLHDWPDEQCVAILTAMRRAATEDSMALIIEDVIPEDGPTPAPARSTSSC
jgi:O-methyltransferase